MPNLPTPATTGDVWGSQLNSFLTQLQSGSDGSINYAATRPTKTAADVGYTMIDTTSREIIRWSGTAWEVLMGGQASGIESLTADKDFWVATDGNDSNPGTSTSPFLTIQKAIDTLYQRTNANGFNVTIKLKPGTYPPQKIVFTGLPIGATTVTIQGAGTNPSDTIIQSSDVFRWAISATKNSSLLVKNLKFQKTGNFTGSNLWAGALNSVFGSVISVDNIDFGNYNLNSGYTGMHLFSNAGGSIYINASINYNISGGAGWHYFSQDNGSITCVYNPAVTVTVLNSVSFTGGIYFSGVQGTMLLLTVNWINKASVTTPSKGSISPLGYLNGLNNANIPGPTWSVDPSGYAS